MPLSSEALVPLSQISEGLTGKDRNKESLWRYLTFEGLDAARSAQYVAQNAKRDNIDAEVESIAEVLRRLIPKQSHKSFDQDLGKVLLDSTTLWDELKRDSCMVEFDLRPPRSCAPGWVSDICPELEQPNVKISRETGSHSKMQSWCLFPKIIFKPIDGEQKIVVGHSIFVDSPAFHEGLEELKRQKEEIAQMRRNLARRLTLPGGTR
jgi:hypothetical protein